MVDYFLSSSSSGHEVRPIYSLFLLQDCNRRLVFLMAVRTFVTRRVKLNSCFGFIMFFQPSHTIWPVLKMTIFWVVAPYSLVEVYRRFRGACCLHHQGDEPVLFTL
jgi:hypothetical protein